MRILFIILLITFMGCATAKHYDCTSGECILTEKMTMQGMGDADFTKDSISSKPIDNIPIKVD